MRDDGIGCIVVTEENAPLGMVTDRDLAVRVIKPGRQHMIAVHVLLEPGGSPAMADLDGARGRVVGPLVEHDLNLILDVIFTEDPKWFAALAPAD